MVTRCWKRSLLVGSQVRLFIFFMMHIVYIVYYSYATISCTVGHIGHLVVRRQASWQSQHDAIGT